MKKKSILIGIALTSFILVACIATSITTQELPTLTVPLPTNTAFAPNNGAAPTATATAVVPPTNTAAATMPILPAQTVVAGSPAAIYQIQMLDPSNGWGWAVDVDNTSRILRTQDGAVTWVDVSPNGQPLQPTDSFFLDPQTAWISLFDSASNAHTLLRTNDGGKTWTNLPQPETVQNARFRFSNANDGIAEAAGVGAGNIYFNLYQTHDGGATWAAIPLVSPKPESGLPDGTIHLCNICGDNLYYDPARTVITYGDLANDPAGVVHLAVSTDLGQHWNDMKLALPDPKYASGMQAPRPPVFFGNDGLLPETIMQYGDNNSIAYKVLAIYVTHDGGQNWSLAPGVLVNDKLIFESVQVLSMQDIFVRCGKNLCASHDGAQTWQTLPENLNFDSTVGGPDYVSQFQFLNPTTGWAVSGEGAATTLWKTTDGGVTWTKVAPTLQK